jgi:hypothetical protein
MIRLDCGNLHFKNRVVFFLGAFRICFAPLCETKSSENEFRAKAQNEIERRKGKSGR